MRSRKRRSDTEIHGGTRRNDNSRSNAILNIPTTSEDRRGRDRQKRHRKPHNTASITNQRAIPTRVATPKRQKKNPLYSHIFEAMRLETSNELIVVDSGSCL